MNTPGIARLLRQYLPELSLAHLYSPVRTLWSMFQSLNFNFLGPSGTLQGVAYQVHLVLPNNRNTSW